MKVVSILMSRAVLLVLVSAVLGSAAAGLPGAVVLGALGQSAGQSDAGKVRTVWDGVYSAEQAERGLAHYEQTCASCHSSGEGPALVGDSFMRRWFEDSLQDVFEKISTSMPENSPGSLSESAYLDLIAFMLEANGFPAGDAALTADPETLSSVLIVGKEGPGGPVPNFSLVQVLGCLAQGDDNAWLVTHGTEPRRTRDPRESPAADLTEAAALPLGDQVFRLMDLPAKTRDALKGQKVQVKGLLIREPKENKLNVTSVQPLGGACPN